MTPSLSAFISSLFLGGLIVVIPLSAVLIYVSSKDRVVRF
uniref:Photosystem II reaction center protein X n=1 Tax=Haptophyceae sp. NIES-3900 TaxID=2748608 RepID=A0A7R6WDV4_9EUKA|nr:photosystem II protein X [Haptophyceae sp. NIES-3900]